MRARSLSALVAGCLFVASGCIVVDGERAQPGRPARHPAAHAPGPPPHAPAHGYRHKHRGRDLAYDSALGAYVVVGLPDVWFFDGHYVRWYGERWEIGLELGGPWRVARVESVPRKLREARHPHGGPPGRTKKKSGR